MYCKTFEQLSKDELYALLRLRQDVFIIEQNSIYTDLDGYDQAAIHYLDFDPSGKLTTYARYRQGGSLNDVKIERVVLDKSVRSKGQGKRLIKMILNDINVHFPEATIVLSSQVEASQFYSSLGFIAQGVPYDDGGIEHIHMFFSA